MINGYCRQNAKLIHNIEGFIENEKEKIVVQYKNTQRSKFPDSIKQEDDVDESANLSHLSHNKSSPSCCPSTYSTDRGCLCMTDNQKNEIVNRGNNRNGNDLFAITSGLYQDV